MRRRRLAWCTRLSRVINGHIEILPDMAIRLEQAGWCSADHGLRLQTPYCLARVRRQEAQIVVKQF